MISAATIQPDIRLTLNDKGVILHVLACGPLADEGLDSWRGQSWAGMTDPAVASQIAEVFREARSAGSAPLLQFTQRFPSGRELPMEYSTVSLGRDAGFIAIGRSLQMVADLQARLQEALDAREQDYWKMRDIESRYKLLFDAADEAVLLVRSSNLRIVEANLAATRALGQVPGAEFLQDMLPRDRRSFSAMLDRVREHGRAPGIILHLGRDGAPWSLRASSIDTQNGVFFLFQLARVGSTQQTAAETDQDVSATELIERLPDGFVVIDQDAKIQNANPTFMDFIQVGAEGGVIGQNLNRWLSRPGFNATALLERIRAQGNVSLLATTLTGELGGSLNVEISGVGDRDQKPEVFGLLLRDVTGRHRSAAVDSFAAALPDPLDDGHENFSLEDFVRSAISAVERRLITSALALSDNNRTVAARKLGLSRQSLHTKLKKYNFD